MRNEIKKNLKDLGFKESEIKVYLSLTSLGEARASEIAKKADMPRTTVISILEKLQAEQFLTVHRYRGVSFYWIESPDALANIYKHKVEVANSLNDLLIYEYRKEAHFPFGKTIDTKSGIQSFIEKLMQTIPKHSIIYTIDQPKAGNYSKIFSEKGNDILFQYKNKRNIKTHTLIPKNTFNDEVIIKASKQNIKIKVLPAEIKFFASLWLINDQLFLFSGNPPFLTIVKQEMIVNSFKSIYDFLWNISEEANK